MYTMSEVTKVRKSIPQFKLVSLTVFVDDQCDNAPIPATTPTGITAITAGPAFTTFIGFSVCISAHAVVVLL